MSESSNPYAAPEANVAPSADADWVEAFPIRAEFGKARGWLYGWVVGGAFLLMLALAGTLILLAAYAAFLWGGDEFAVNEEDLADLPTVALLLFWDIGWTAFVVCLLNYARHVRNFSLGDQNQTLEAVLASQRLLWVVLAATFVILTVVGWLVGVYP